MSWRIGRGQRPAAPGREGSALRRAARQPRAPAVRVAAVTTLILAALYLVAMVIFNVIVGNRLVAQVDTQLQDTLRDAQRGAGFSLAVLPDGNDRDVGSPPILLWRISGTGRMLQQSGSAPPLPASVWPRSGPPVTARLGPGTFRLKTARVGGDWLVAGQSLADTAHIQRVLLTAEVVAGPVFLAVIFFGTLVVGLKASGPIEQARRRQLEFTADASHELRTPLSVIEAEVGLALSASREASQYQDALERVSRESHRLRRIVDDLLWLARFDSEPADPGYEPVDVSTIAAVCADRFSAVAASRGVDLSVHCEGEPDPLITAPPEWVDRLTGVLMDNACRYAATGTGASAVRIVVACHGGRVSLAVEDSGPGIPPDERPRLFDRFYRSVAGVKGEGEAGGAAGLGLAIADAVVRSTGGRWRVDDSPLGGARMQVTWHRPAHRHHVPSWRVRERHPAQLASPGPEGLAERPGDGFRRPATVTEPNFRAQ